MSEPVDGRLFRPRTLDRALLLVAGCALALGGVQLALALPGSGAVWWVFLLATAVFFMFIAAGLVAWHRRPANLIGPLIVLGGFAVYAATLGDTGVPALIAVGDVCATVVLAVLVHLLLAFPSGHIHTIPARATVAAAYAVAVVLQAPQYLFTPGPLMIADEPALAAAGSAAQHVAGAVVVIAAAAILAYRLVRADAAHRRILLPLSAYGMLALLLVPLRTPVLEGLLALPSAYASAVQFVIVAGVPVAFTLAMLRGGFARTGELEELAAWLGQVGGARSALPTVLARALGDTSVQILFWMPERGTWADGQGRRADLPVAPGRGVVEVTLAGERIGAIVYDSALIADAEPVRRAARVTALALERERLLAALLAQRAELVSSRERIVSAADQERRRIASDLHDGLQVRLVLLALDAQHIASAPSTTVAAARAVALRQSIDDAAATLRRFVHDVMPAALIERGLGAAVEDLVDRMPLPTALQLELPDGGLSEAIQSTAYFVVSEGLANTLKHAHAKRVSVRLRRAGGLLEVEVHDDGSGGASVHAGTGLSGLADRLDVLGGVLRVDSMPGYGTHLRAELPCRW